MTQTFLAILLTLVPQIDLPDHISFTYQGETISSANRTDFKIPLLDDRWMDADKYLSLMEDIEKEVSQKPINASIDDQGQIIPGKPGKKLDRDKFKQRLFTYFYDGGPAELEVPIRPAYPKVDGELLESIQSQQIGEYITFFNQNNKNRSHNIALASEAINNHVVFPGEIFSFNNVVGKRTEEKGYLPAPVIVRGELAEDIGGGICQVSSTLYNAVDSAGIEIMQRYSHSKQVPYVPPGRDATVSWYGPDFTFKNNYQQPILIRSKATHGKMVIHIQSSNVIQHEPKEIPNASTELPKEINVNSN